MNSFGRIFRVSLFGESHGECVGVVIDGCPPGISLQKKDFLTDLARRRGEGLGVTTRREKDDPLLMSGIFQGKTTGAPLTILFENKDTKSADYERIKDIPRPGHADFTAYKKFKAYNDYRGGGHFSGRLTLGLVAAGVVAKKIIAPVRVNSKLLEARGSKDIKPKIEEARWGMILWGPWLSAGPVSCRLVWANLSLIL
jgi:chorismate synthase